jgi:predicted PurR-regulated permease PerM
VLLVPQFCDDGICLATPETMPLLDRRTANILLTILVFAGFCAAIYCSRQIILLFVLAVFFAYLINPVVKVLQRHSLFFKNLRGPAVVEVYITALILVALSAYAIAPSVATNTARMLDEIPVVLDGLTTGNIATELRVQYGWTSEQESRFRAFLARHRQNIDNLVATVDGYLANAVQVLGGLLLIPILAIFFLREGEQIADIFIRLLPSSRRSRIRTVANELHIVLTQYIRAQVSLCFISFLFYLGVMLLLGFPHAFALAILGGLLEFIPAIGWFTTLVAIVGVGVLNHSRWVWMAGLLGGWRLVQDYYITPKIMGTHLKIHPLAAIFGVLVGAEIGGIVGIYLAVPLMASARVIWCTCAPAQNGRGNHSNSGAITKEPSSLVETEAIADL